MNNKCRSTAKQRWKPVVSTGTGCWSDRDSWWWCYPTPSEG